MKTWKLSIKPESKKGVDPFDVCQKKSLIGLGWHHAFVEEHPSNFDQAKKLVERKWGKWPYSLKYFLEDMQDGDHVWVHQNGNYHLCKVTGTDILYGKEIDLDYRDLDLGHARSATWIHVPDKLVSGSIQRGMIAPRTIQQIKVTQKDMKFNELIFEKLKADPNWLPRTDEEKLHQAISNISKAELFSLMSPDDIEDIVSAYLQSQGWILIKSTCFRSKPVFEFMMLNKHHETCHVQVKSGKRPDSLSPSKYQQYTANQETIFLFSTNPNPYPGSMHHGIKTITHHEIVLWIKTHLWALTLPLKLRLWVFLCEK